jgi:dUTP pyrophosphatase
MQIVQIPIINLSNNNLPAYTTLGSAGLDIAAFLADDITLMPMQRALIPTGLFIALPLGYEAQVRSRSGLAIAHGLACLNAPGTIDSDYRGEIKIILINLGSEAFVIHSGMRIAQLVVAQHASVAWEPTTQLGETTRSSGGFGSSGT